MDLTMSFAPTPRERWQGLRAGWYLGVLRVALTGLPLAAVGLVILIARVTPGTLSGWAAIIAITGLSMVGFPYAAMTRGVITVSRRARTESQRVDVTLTDSSVRYAQDGYAADVAWRHVTSVRMSGSCWLISTRMGSSAIVLPMRAVPPGSEHEVAEFLGRWRDLVSADSGQ